MARKVLVNLDMTGNQIVNLADPSANNHAVNLGFLQSLVLGGNNKSFVDVATTIAGTLASSFANGQTVDGVTLTTGMRILIKNQADGTENGIYTVNASGAPTRATDADASSEFANGALVGVRRGNAYPIGNGDSVWMLANDTPPTIGTDALSFIRINSTSTYISGDGLNESPAGTFNVVAGDGVELVSDAVRVKLNGATLTRSGSGLSVTNPKLSFAQSIGNGSSTSIAVTHNLGTRDVAVDIYDNSTFETVDCDIVRTDTNTVTFGFTTAPASNAYRVVILG
jgi:hypothetical protein